MAWSPIASGDLARRARERVLEIVRGLAPARDTGEFANVRISHALLYEYAARAGWVSDGSERAGAALEEALEELSAFELTGGLFGGAAELGWAVAHLGDDESAASVCDPIDGALGEMPHYDLIVGDVGLGVYAREHLGLPSGERLARRVLDRLGALARRDGDGRYWVTAPAFVPESEQAANPDGCVDLGVAHGVAGVLGLTARFVADGFAAEAAAPLCAGALAYLRAISPGRAPARFPPRVTEGEHDAPPTRLAWCYGDAGIALQMLAAARALGDEGAEAEAIAIARTAAGRADRSTGVVDASFCHGAAGLAHVFGRLYQATRSEPFRAAAERWLGEALALAPARPGTGLLMGTAGIALVLLAAATDVEPAWDRMLLCDLRS